MYKDFLKGESKTFEGRYGAEEYISMAENRLNDINLKLKEIKKENLSEQIKDEKPSGQSEQEEAFHFNSLKIARENSKIP